MLELKRACPFCGGKLDIEVLHGYHTSYGVKCEKDDCLMNHINYTWDNEQDAIKAVEGRPEPHKYTVKELQKMEGQPVYIIPIGNIQYVVSRWMLIIGSCMEAPRNIPAARKDYPAIIFQPASGLSQLYSWKTYGKTWEAYDRPPRED